MEQQKYWECFRIKTGRWVELKLYWVMLTLQAASNVIWVAVCRARLAVLIPYHKRHGHRTVGSAPHPLRGVGDPTRLCVQPPCVQPPLDHGRERAAPACRGGMGPSGPGSDWQRDQRMVQATDSLRCRRRKTFWTFTLNINAFVHILINMFWTLLTLLSFLQNINFSGTSNGLAVILSFRISQGSVAT